MIKLVNILKEMGIEKGAFHGFGMKPKDMRVDTCNIEWTSSDQIQVVLHFLIQLR